MNARKLITDLAAAFGAQGISFACSVLTMLLVPKVLGVEQFSYWQLFVFYSSYVSFFQLGLNDGVYLQHGGETRDRIDKRVIHDELCVGVMFQVAIAVCIALCGLCFEPDGFRAAAIVGAAAYLIISNTTFYFQYVFQAMNETRLASFSTVVNRGFYLLPLCAGIILEVDTFVYFVLFYVAAQGLSLLYCLWNARDFLIGWTIDICPAIRETIRSMKIGIVLTIANVTGMLIIGLARQVVDVVWGLSAFGQISLSLSIVNFALAFLSQAAMVLFPALRLAGSKEESRYFRRLSDGLAVVLPFAMLLYAPLRAVVGLWLPQYEEGLRYLSLLFPVCLFEAQTNLVVSTFLKVRNEPKVLLLINVCALVVSVGAMVMATHFYQTPMAVMSAALFGVGIRYMFGSWYLSRVYGSWNHRLTACMYLEAIAFVLIATFTSLPVGFILCCGLLLAHIFINRREYNDLFGGLKSISTS